MSYAVIAVGGKQYRVTEGEYLLVDRLPLDEGATFTPDVLMVGGDGDPKLGKDAAKQKVTIKVAEHVLGDKVIVGKHRQRTGYRLRKGHRSRLSRIEVQSIGAARSSTRSKSASGSKSTAAAKSSTGSKSTTRTRSTTRKKTEEGT
jgi:large subunit ribosomal protein L21